MPNPPADESARGVQERLDNLEDAAYNSGGQRGANYRGDSSQNDQRNPRIRWGWLGVLVGAGALVVAGGLALKECDSLVSYKNSHGKNEEKQEEVYTGLPIYNWFQVTSAVKTSDRTVMIYVTDVPDQEVDGGPAFVPSTYVVDQKDVGANLSADRWQAVLDAAKNVTGTPNLADKNEDVIMHRIRDLLRNPAQYGLELRDVDNPGLVIGRVRSAQNSGKPTYVRVSDRSGGESIYPIRPRRAIGRENEIHSVPFAGVDFRFEQTPADETMDLDSAEVTGLAEQRARARGIYGRDVLGNKAAAEKTRRAGEFETNFGK